MDAGEVIENVIAISIVAGAINQITGLDALSALAVGFIPAILAVRTIKRAMGRK